jgi:hypothetical protein
MELSPWQLEVSRRKRRDLEPHHRATMEASIGPRPQFREPAVTSADDAEAGAAMQGGS